MMHINWEAVMENERRQFEEMNEADRFAYFLLLQYGSPYGWGNENPEASDCSGAVCMSLFAATGLLIRTTADDLMRRAFTRTNPGANEIRAVFYVTQNDRPHGDRTARAGTATHIAGFVGEGVVLNSERPLARVRRVSDVSGWYLRNGHDEVVRGLDRAALERLAKAGNVFGLDPEFAKYFNIGGGNAGAGNVESAKLIGTEAETETVIGDCGKAETETGEAEQKSPNRGGADAKRLVRFIAIIKRVIRLLLGGKLNARL